MELYGASSRAVYAFCSDKLEQTKAFWRRKHSNGYCFLWSSSMLPEEPPRQTQRIKAGITVATLKETPLQKGFPCPSHPSLLLSSRCLAALFAPLLMLHLSSAFLPIFVLACSSPRCSFACPLIPTMFCTNVAIRPGGPFMVSAASILV